MKKVILALAATMALLSVECEADQPKLKKQKKLHVGQTGPEQPPPQKKEIDGIVTIGPAISPQEVAPKIIIGKTTLKETLALLGDPHNIAMNGESHGRTVMYVWRKQFSGPVKMNEIMGNPVLSALPGPFALFSLKGSKDRLKAQQEKAAELQAPPKTLTMVFGSDGVLKDCQFNPHIPVATVSPSLTAVTPPR